MNRYLAVGLLLASFVQIAQAAPSLDTGGTWLTEDGRARIRLERCGSSNERLCGYVVWLKAPAAPDGSAKLDAYNPDPAKRARPALGLQLLQGLKANADGHFEGQIYNADDGKSYDVTLWSDAQDRLSVRGCLVSFLCKTQAWSRARDLAPGQLPGPTGAANGPTPEPAFAKSLPASTVAKAPQRKPLAPVPALPVE